MEPSERDDEQGWCQDHADQRETNRVEVCSRLPCLPTADDGRHGAREEQVGTIAIAGTVAHAPDAVRACTPAAAGRLFTLPM